MSDHHHPTPREIRAIQEELQLLADNPKLRRRHGDRVRVASPFADSRRPTDAGDRSQRFISDCRVYAGDQSRNYAAGLL